MKDVVSRCPIEEAMRTLSGRWPALLLYYLKDGTKRFSDLKRDNPKVSQRMLTLELRKLEKAGIVRRTAHSGYPLRVDYSLTPPGMKLVPLIDAIGDWWEETETDRLQTTWPDSLHQQQRGQDAQPRSDQCGPHAHRRPQQMPAFADSEARGHRRIRWNEPSHPTQEPRQNSGCKLHGSQETRGFICRSAKEQHATRNGAR